MFNLRVSKSKAALALLSLSAAMKEGKWKDSYASSNDYEYFAVGTEAFFNQSGDPNRAGKMLFGLIPVSKLRNNVTSRLQLKSYDESLYNILSSIHNGSNSENLIDQNTPADLAKVEAGPNESQLGLTTDGKVYAKRN